MKSTDRCNWFRDAKWGVFIHFLAPNHLNNLTLEENANAWNTLVDEFDVKILAQQLQECKARYLIFTIGQNSGHYCSPNQTYDSLVKINPSKCSKRDLIKDLYEALSVYDIRLITYFTCNAPVSDPIAVERLEDKLGQRSVEFQNNWQDVIREWSLRWGNNVSGWWIDGCYFNDTMYKHEKPPNFKSFAAALRMGNPESILGFNPGVYYPPFTVDKEEDYTAGEVNEPRDLYYSCGTDKHAQFHVLSFLGPFWKQGPVRFSADETIAFTRSITDYGGVMSWDVPHHDNGQIDKKALSVLKELGKEIDRTRNYMIKPTRKWLKYSYEFMSVPKMTSNCNEPGRIQLKVENTFDKPISESISMGIIPKNFAQIKPQTEYEFSLKAQEEKTVTLEIIQEREKSADETSYIHIQRKGDARVLKYPLPVRKQLEIKSIEPGLSTTELADRMNDIEKLPMMHLGRAVGYLQIARSEDNLLIYCDIFDKQRAITHLVWAGACLELFGVEKPGMPINQLFFQPRKGEKQIQALITDETEIKGGFKYLPVDYAYWQIEDSITGYQARLSVSLSQWLKTQSTPDQFFLDAVLTISESDGTNIRATLFDSTLPAQSTDGYAQISSTI